MLGSDLRGKAFFHIMYHVIHKILLGSFDQVEEVPFFAYFAENFKHG